MTAHLTDIARYLGTTNPVELGAALLLEQAGFERGHVQLDLPAAVMIWGAFGIAVHLAATGVIVAAAPAGSLFAIGTLTLARAIREDWK